MPDSRAGSNGLYLITYCYSSIAAAGQNLPRRGSSNDSPDPCLGQLSHTIAKNMLGAEVCLGTFLRKPSKFST